MALAQTAMAKNFTKLMTTDGTGLAALIAAKIALKPSFTLMKALSG
jgi:hypothetical protein